MSATGTIAAFMRRPVWGPVSVLALVVAAFLVLGIVTQALAPTPQGPALSSYSTSADGVAAWAQLLEQFGHPVSQLRAPVSSGLDPRQTLVMLGAGPLTPPQIGGLDSFLDRGGRLVISGDAAALQHLTGAGASNLTVLPSPARLENRELGEDDNAAWSLALAGASGRPVLFDEDLHGYGLATGLAALPTRWWVALVGLALAAGAWILNKARRLGGPDQQPAVTPAPRAVYVDALAAVVVRTRDAAIVEDLVRAERERERRFERSLRP